MYDKNPHTKITFELIRQVWRLAAFRSPRRWDIFNTAKERAKKGGRASNLLDQLKRKSRSRMKYRLLHPKSDLIDGCTHLSTWNELDAIYCRRRGVAMVKWAHHTSQIDQCPTVSKKLVCFLRIPIFVFLRGSKKSWSSLYIACCLILLVYFCI